MDIVELIKRAAAQVESEPARQALYCPWCLSEIRNARRIGQGMLSYECTCTDERKKTSQTRPSLESSQVKPSYSPNFPAE